MLVPTHLYGQDLHRSKKQKYNSHHLRPKKNVLTQWNRVDSREEDSQSNERVQAPTPTPQYECRVSVSQKDKTALLGMQRCLLLHSVTSHRSSWCMAVSMLCIRPNAYFVINKVLLHTAKHIHFRMICGCFCPAMAELNSCYKDCGANRTCIYSLTLRRKKCARSCFK